MKTNILILAILLLFTSCEKDVYITPPPDVPANGYAYINSVPNGAAIFINGKNSGKVTPDSLTYIEYGAALLTLKKDGFYDTTFTVVFAKDVKNEISVDFTKNPRMLGSISFTSIPSGAEIFINDSSINRTTPFKVNNVIPGTYSVKCKKTGFRDVEGTVKVTSGVVAPSYLTLQDTTKWVDYKTTNSGLSANETTAIEIDKNNRIWIGTENKGISILANNNWENFNTENSLIPSNKIICLSKDLLGNILIGTDKGFVKYSMGTWEVFNISNSNLPNNYISDIAVYNDEIWLATKSGLAKFNNGNFSIYNTSNSLLPDNWVTAAGFRNNGKLYVGTYYGGIAEMNGDSFSIYSKPTTNLPGNSITCINGDKNGKVWFGHLPTSNESGGLSYFNGTKFTTISGLTVNKINNIFTDNNNVTWVGTDDGIVTFDINLTKTLILVQNTGLTNNFVRSIKQDKTGAIWIATYGGGVCKYKKY